MMSAASRYLKVLRDRLEGVETLLPEVDQIAAKVQASLRDDGVLHVFGTGHSQLVALELAGRAAGLAGVNAIADPALSPMRGQRAAATERLAGYGSVILDAEDLRAGEVLIVVSNSGINPVPIDVALGAKERGLFVAALVSVEHSRATAPRHPSGKRLFDVADAVLDIGTPVGDGALTVGDVGVGPLSTVVSAAILHALICRVAELLAADGDDVGVLVSQNLNHGPDINTALYERFADRMCW